MKKHLDDKTRWLKACQKRCEELAAILWIQLKINSSCRRGQKELVLDRPAVSAEALHMSVNVLTAI
jgi:hypothetical protein